MTTHIPLEHVLAVKVEGEWLDVDRTRQPGIGTVTIDVPGTSIRQALVEGPAGGGPYLNFTGADGHEYAIPLTKISVWRFT